jgi:prevent-host-death family protein
MVRDETLSAEPSQADPTAAAAAVSGGYALATVGIRGLARNVSAVVAEVARTGRPTILTKHGRPVAAIVPIPRAGRPLEGPADPAEPGG